MNTLMKRFKRFEFPHGFVILFIFILLTALITYLIPAGEYDRTTDNSGQSIVIDGTYQTIEATPTSLLDLFNAIHLGMVEAAEIIFFIFVVGGAFRIFRETNAIEASFHVITEKLRGRELLFIPVIMLFFAISGATWGMAEEVIPFILIAIPIALMMGFDSITGTAMVLVGVYAGFGSAFMNPFTVGVAQGIADLPTFSGMGIRFIFWLIFVSITILYVTIYAKKVQKDPTISPMYQEDLQRGNTELIQRETLTKRQITILSILVFTLVVLAAGVVMYDWYITEIASLFLIMGIIVGLIAKFPINKIAETFIKGCEEMVMGALIVGVAYAILIILEQSHTIDTILYGISNFVAGLPTSFSALGMYATQSILNFIVPSGSGQAAVSMPIMTPLSDLVGVNRQTAVLAFQYGDGISNILTPTAGVLMASLAIAKIPWIKWVRWVLPLIVIQYLLGGLFITIAHMFIWT